MNGNQPFMLDSHRPFICSAPHTLFCMYNKLQRFLNLRYWSTGGETQYPVDYENIFYRIFFVYLRAESHNKVATIIFYFARAVSHATVRTDRLCSNLVGAPPRLSYITINISTVAEKLTTLQTGIQKVGAKLMISGGIRKLYSQSDFWGKN